MRTKIFKSKKQNPYINHTIKGLTLALSLSFFGSSSVWSQPQISLCHPGVERILNSGNIPAILEQMAGSPKPLFHLPSNWSQVTSFLGLPNGWLLKSDQNSFGFSVDRAKLGNLSPAQVAQQIPDLILTEALTPEIRFIDGQNEREFVRTLGHESRHFWQQSATQAGNVYASGVVFGLHPGDPNFVGLVSQGGDAARFGAFVNAFEAFGEVDANNIAGGSMAHIPEVRSVFFHLYRGGGGFQSGGPIQPAFARQAVSNYYHWFNTNSPYAAFNRELYNALGARGNAQAVDDLYELTKAAGAGASDLPLSNSVRSAFQRFSKRIGKAASNSIPVVGTAAGVGFVVADVNAGNYGDATFGTIGMVPGGGDVLEVAWILGNLGFDVFQGCKASIDQSENAIFEFRKGLGLHSSFPEQVKSKAAQLLQASGGDASVREALSAIANWVADPANPNDNIPNELFENLMNAARDAYYREMNRFLEPTLVSPKPSCLSSNCLGGSKPATTY